MRALIIVLLGLFSAGVSCAQEFERAYAKSIQPVLAQPLRWVAALAPAAPTLPEAFLTNPQSWRFEPYTAGTELPTASGNDVWASFTLAATATPQRVFL